MLYDLLTVGGSVLTLLLLMAVGFILAKMGKLTKGTLTQISTLLLYVVCPAIMIDSLMAEQRSAQTVRMLLASGGVLVATYVLNMILIQGCFRRSPEDCRGVLRFGSIYGNTGFMGIPLIQAVLGEAGMITAITSLVIFNISIWTHGAVLVGGKERASIKKAFFNPGTIGFLIAIAVFALQIPIPAPVGKALGFISDLNTPLAMLVIGGQMAAVDLKSLFKERRLYLSALIKLLAAPAVTLLVILPFGLDPVILTAAVILAGCPTAGATSLMSETMGKDTSLAARMVTLSTVFSVVTLPVVAAVSRLVAG